MWNFFKKIKEKKEQKRLLAEQRVISLRVELKAIEDKAYEESSSKYSSQCKYVEKWNSTCPNCKGRNVNDRIKRHQGSIDGSVSGSGGGFLTFNSYSMSGKIHGELDTNPVNKCNDCEHEWKKESVNFISNSSIIEGELNTVRYFLSGHYDVKMCKFDPMDVHEKYNSKEEKQAALLVVANSTYYIERIKEFWGGISTDALMLILSKYGDSWDKEHFKKYYDEELLLSVGFTKLK